jgi:hypothetical protein
MIILLSLSLSACSQIETRIEYLPIPDVYIYCSYLPTPNISDDAYEDADNGDWKRLALELTQDRFTLERHHNECVRNMESIYEYQNKMLKDED